jgi:hypothetical protein
MPIFHFHFRGGYTLLDPRGIDLPDAKAALGHGAELAVSFIKVARDLNGPGPRAYWHVDVSDADGNTLGRFDVPEK